MTRVLAAVGPEPETARSADRAIEFARAHDAELDLLAVAASNWWSPLRHDSDERPERAALAQLSRAAARALAAGVRMGAVSFRRGRLLAEVTRHAESSGAHIVFITRLRPRWWARVLDRPRAELHEVTLSPRLRGGVRRADAEAEAVVAHVTGAARTKAVAGAR